MLKDTVLTITVMAPNTSAIERMINSMGKVRRSGLMALNIKVITLKGKSKAKAFFNGLMGQDMKVSFIRIVFMVKGSYYYYFLS